MNSKLSIDNNVIVRKCLSNGCPSGYVVSVGSWDIDNIIKETVKSILTYENIEKIILTYKSFPDRSSPATLIKQTVEKLKADNL